MFSLVNRFANSNLVSKSLLTTLYRASSTNNAVVDQKASHLSDE